MTDTSFLRLKQVFSHLVDLPDDERARYLDAQDDIDADSRQRLENLLRADVRHARATARRALHGDRGHVDEHAWTGRRIGAFEIRRELGRGGMGSVFLAERVEGGVTQQVAIKIVHSRQLDAITLGRFRLERQVLALLQHPNLAGLYDFGELADGMPYLVMEYVDGLPLKQYLRERNVPLAERLRLFIHICSAVSHAHRNLIVHRDIKPGNILISRDGTPKLLDFGIAKPLGNRLGAVDVENTATAHRIFSLANAAPEQLRGEATTVSCDVYGLGALLYELLCDRPAQDIAGLSMNEAEQRILNQDPPPPSQRAMSTHSAKGWHERLRGDLDAIALLALRKDPDRRYRSVDEFADDVRRYLDGKPVSAHRGSRRYRFVRFVARHRRVLISGAIVAVILISSLTLILRQYVATAVERARAQSVTRILTTALKSIDPAKADGKELTAREVFEQVGAVALSSPEEQPDTRAELVATIARIYLQLGMPNEAQRLLDSLPSGESSTATEQNIALMRVQALLANDRPALAEEKLAISRSLAGSAQQSAEWDLLEARLRVVQGKQDVALRLLRGLSDATAGVEDALQREARRDLSEVLLSLERREEAHAVAVSLLEHERRLFPQGHPDLLATLTQVIRIDSYLERTDEAAALAKEILPLANRLYGENSAIYANALTHYAAALGGMGNLREARDHSERALRITEGLFGKESAAAARMQFNLANLTDSLGDAAVAQTHYRQAALVGEKTLPEHSPALFLFRLLAAYSLVNSGDYAEAAAFAKLARQMSERHPGIDVPDLGPLRALIEAMAEAGHRPGNASRERMERALSAANAAAVDAGTRETITALMPRIDVLRKP